MLLESLKTIEQRYRYTTYITTNIDNAIVSKFWFNELIPICL